MRTMVAYGGGTNSCAVLCGLYAHNDRPDLILFADTGGEKPHTYEHMALMQGWLLERGWPEITIVKLNKPGGWESLEDQCRRLKVLPPIAYGFKTCSQRYKIVPQDKFVEGWAGTDEKLIKILGYDFDETRRWLNKPRQVGRFHMRYPLVEWRWGRDECILAIEAAGLPQPGKSACFFCPSSRKSEVHWLKEHEPLLYARAVAMERDAKVGRGEGGSTGFKTIKGLGRSFSWERINDGVENPPDQSCDCYDGEPED